MQIKPQPIIMKTQVIEAPTKTATTRAAIKNDFVIPHLTPKTVSEDPSKYFRVTPKPPMPRKYKLLIAAGVALVVLIALQAVVGGLNAYFDQNRLIPQPVIQIRLQWPFRLEKRIPPAPPQVMLPTPVETVKAAEPQPTPQLDRLIKFIWTIESGQGKAHKGWQKTCEDKGLWNEIGYGYDGFCFANADEGFAKLREELPARLAKNGLLETLCVYNLGYNRDSQGNRIPHTGCNYYDTYTKN
jgi:hypothetical protein